MYSFAHPKSLIADKSPKTSFLLKLRSLIYFITLGIMKLLGLNLDS